MFPTDRDTYIEILHEIVRKLTKNQTKEKTYKMIEKMSKKVFIEKYNLLYKPPKMEITVKCM